MIIRRANLEDVDAIRFLFRDTVLHVNAPDYSEAEIKAWSDGYASTDNWRTRILQQHFLVALAGTHIIGFASVTNNGYLDVLYVHKDHQRKGTAQALLNQIFHIASKNEIHEVFCHVSRSALPFFNKNNFRKKGEYESVVRGVKFTTIAMTHALLPKSTDVN